MDVFARAGLPFRILPLREGRLVAKLILTYLYVALFSVAAVGFVTIVLWLSRLVSPRNPTQVKLLPYECGIDPIGEGSAQFTIRYYIFAILFVAFDIEAIFLYPWALVLRKLGFYGFFEMLLFIAVLLVGLLYAWKKGALKWI